MSVNSERILFILAMLLSVLGCRREEPETYYVEQAMLAYCWFPVGSYWIYEEAHAVGLQDSVYVLATDSKIIQDDGDDFKSKTYSLTIKVLGKSRKQTMSARPVGEHYAHVRSKMLESYSDSSGEYYDHILFWDTRGKDTLGIYPHPFLIRHDSITVHNIRYHDAIEVVTDPAMAADWTWNTVWVRNVGLVRRSLVDGTVWELVRYGRN